MGRRIHLRGGSGQDPDTTRRQRVIRGSGSPSFGIERQCPLELTHPVVDPLLDLQDEGGLPGADRLEISGRWIVPLLGQNVIASQLHGGRVRSGFLGRVRARLAKTCPTRNNLTTVTRGPIQVVDGRVVYAEITSPTVAREIGSIAAALDGDGLRLPTRGGRPRVVLAEIVDNQRLAGDEEQAVVAALEARVPREPPVEGWNTHPFDIFDPAATP